MLTSVTISSKQYKDVFDITLNLQVISDHVPQFVSQPNSTLTPLRWSTTPRLSSFTLTPAHIKLTQITSLQTYMKRGRSGYITVSVFGRLVLQYTSLCKIYDSRQQSQVIGQTETGAAERRCRAVCRRYSPAVRPFAFYGFFYAVKINQQELQDR